MGKLTVFNFITLNGFYKGDNEDISWHQHGGEEAEYSEESLQSESTLLFGRVTYQMMESFWSTPIAAEAFPKVAQGMNQAEKIVFSTTLKKVKWNNSRLVKGNLIDEIKKLKKGKKLTLLGSGTILTQLAEVNLVDEYQLMIDPVVIGVGTPAFKNIKHNLSLKLKATRAFKSGVVLLTYHPSK